jgi:hypothetical protein
MRPRYGRSEKPLEPDWDDEEEEVEESDEEPSFDEVGEIKRAEAAYEGWLESLKDRGGR